jgi:hypothetical protein
MDDYKTPKLVNRSASIININGNDLEVVYINGILYRADKHDASLMRRKPAYFGDYESAVRYMQDGSYLKYYRTRRSLKLLSLNNTYENILRIRNFFINYLAKRNKSDIVKIYITFILLQITYGLVIDSMKNLETFNLDIEFIGNYLRDVYHIDKYVILDILRIITQYTNESILPSRFSLRPIDKLLMGNLKQLLLEFNFDGIWFFSENVLEGNDTLCRTVNRELFSMDTDKLTCVPSEIGIFEPIETLYFYKIFKQESGKYIEVTKKHDSMSAGDPYIRKYYKYKSKYLSLTNSKLLEKAI